MLGHLDHLAGQQLQRPACPTGRRLGAGGGHQQRLLLAVQLALRARPRQHQAPLGAVHRRATDADSPGDLLVAGPGIGGQQDLRPLELACRVLAAAQQRPELGVFFLAQFDPIPYIHSDLLEGETRRIQR
jgi:hypothetical protein